MKKRDIMRTTNLTSAAVLLINYLLNGCATSNVDFILIDEYDEAISSELEKSPICNTNKDCKLKWFAARNWILNNSHMKIQHITDDFIETYNPPMNRGYKIGFRVVKQPLSEENSYRIVLHVLCNNYSKRCNKERLFDNLKSFNNYVSSVN